VVEIKLVVTAPLVIEEALMVLPIMVEHLMGPVPILETVSEDAMETLFVTILLPTAVEKRRDPDVLILLLI
jgi:hypothetical protein